MFGNFVPAKPSDLIWVIPTPVAQILVPKISYPVITRKPPGLHITQAAERFWRLPQRTPGPVEVDSN